MSETPEDLYYLASHEWLKVLGDGFGLVGITDFAQGELGDIVFVELPNEGTEVEANAEISVIESVKTASDIYSPVSGTIVEVNQLLDETPEVINEQPYEGGWIYKIELSDENEIEDLLNFQGYIDSCDQ